MNSVKKGYLAEGKQNKTLGWPKSQKMNIICTVCDSWWWTKTLDRQPQPGSVSVSVWAAQMECPLQTHRRPSVRTYRIVEIQQISGQLGQFSCWSTLFLVFWNLWRSASHGAIQFHIASHTQSFTSTYRNQRQVWKIENWTYFCLWVS